MRPSSLLAVSGRLTSVPPGLCKSLSLSLALGLSLLTAEVFADSLYGKCVRNDGSKVDGTVKVSTDWNDEKAYPKNGQYRLDFGGKVGKKVTVYVNGSKYTTITVKGDVKLDIKVK
jgi:hypothetical protein